MHTDTAVVRRAIEGDERAMRLLWNQHAPHVEAVVRRLAGDPDLAQDIAQEVWIQIFRALPSWRGDSAFSTWVHRLAINRTLNAMRRVNRIAGAETAIAEDSAIVEQDGDDRMLAATINDAAQRLSPGARTVFLLHDVEGFTHEEIATELGITPGGSKSQLFKARAKLRRLLAPLVDRLVVDRTDATRDGPMRGHTATRTIEHNIEHKIEHNVAHKRETKVEHSRGPSRGHATAHTIGHVRG